MNGIEVGIPSLCHFTLREIRSDKETESVFEGKMSIWRLKKKDCRRETKSAANFSRASLLI